MWKVYCCTPYSPLGCAVDFERILAESKSALKKSRSSSPKDETFSDSEKELLQKTWTPLSEDKISKGISIFLDIFEQRPEAKDVFHFTNLSTDTLKENHLFRSHAMRFMLAIETTVESLDALDLALIPILHDLGKYHANVAGFKLDYLPVFMDAVLHVFKRELGKDWTDDVSDAWAHLASFIAEKLYEGVTESKKRSASCSRVEYDKECAVSSDEISSDDGSEEPLFDKSQ